MIILGFLERKRGVCLSLWLSFCFNSKIKITVWYLLIYLIILSLLEPICKHRYFVNETDSDGYLLYIITPTQIDLYRSHDDLEAITIANASTTDWEFDWVLNCKNFEVLFYFDSIFENKLPNTCISKNKRRFLVMLLCLFTSSGGV